jgi:hypothetical protein
LDVLQAARQLILGVRRPTFSEGRIMADKPQSLGKIIVQGLGGVLLLIAIVYAVMYFMKPQQLPHPQDTRQISFEPKEIALDKGQSQVVRLQVGNPPDANFQVFVEAPSELGVGGVLFLNPGQKVYDLKVTTKDDTKAGTYFIKAGDASCKVTVR